MTMSTNIRQSEEYLDNSFNEQERWPPELQQYGLLRGGGWSLHPDDVKSEGQQEFLNSDLLQFLDNHPMAAHAAPLAARFMSCCIWQGIASQASGSGMGGCREGGLEGVQALGLANYNLHYRLKRHEAGSSKAKGSQPQSLRPARRVPQL